MLAAMDYKIILKALLSGPMKQEELARELGVTQPTVSRWLAGQRPQGPTLDSIRDLGRDHGLYGGDDHEAHQRKPEDKPEGNNLISEIDLVAGLGGGGIAAIEASSNNGITFAKEVVRDYWRLPDWMLSRLGVQAPHIACFPSRGDSMQPTIIDGDVVFIDTRHRVPSPPGIYALADEFGGVILKRLEVVSRPNDETITIHISSDNPKHRSRELTLPEVEILGRYIGRFTL